MIDNKFELKFGMTTLQKLTVVIRKHNGPLAFEILEATRQKMADLGRDTRGLEYEKYKRMLEE